MQSYVHCLSLAAVLAMLGCSSAPMVRPVNQINEPIFFQGNHLALEAVAGSQLINSDLESNYEPSWLIEPGLQAHAHVTDWAGYTVWPLLWNFLLTGNQYRDSVHLEVRKLSVATTLGMSGISYSQRDGWNFRGGFGLLAKFLFSERVFAKASAMAQLDDVRSTDRGTGTGGITLGYQFDPRNSFFLSQTSTVHRIEERAYYQKHGIAFHDEDIHNDLRLGHRFYRGRSHVFGPEIGYGCVNTRFGRDDYYLIGLAYTYVIK